MVPVGTDFLKGKLNNMQDIFNMFIVEFRPQLTT